MLRSANENSRHCYEQALAAAESASNANSPGQRQFYLNMEANWLRLGASYEHAERLAAFVDELRSLHKRPFCPACDTPMRPIGLQWRPGGVVELQYKCINCDSTKSVVEIDLTKNS